MGEEARRDSPTPLDAVVNEVIAEARVRPEELRPEERAFLEQHALKKPLRVLDVWALGVGVVVAGAYFGWNLGLKDNGPVAMLVAGGPLAYGRRTAGPLLGFVMGWSMFLECLFAAIGTALATGGYIAFLLNPNHPDPLTTTTCSILCALLFLAV